MIRSDHKPLQRLFDNTRAIPQIYRYIELSYTSYTGLSIASARLQRWSLILSAYDYTILYQSGEEHANADSLSRLSLPEPLSTTPQPADIILLMETLQTSPVTAQQIRQWMDKDPLLSRVRTLVLQGWRDGEVEEMRPFNRRSEEQSVQDGCVL